MNSGVRWSTAVSLIWVWCWRVDPIFQTVMFYCFLTPSHFSAYARKVSLLEQWKNFFTLDVYASKCKNTLKFTIDAEEKSTLCTKKASKLKKYCKDIQFLTIFLHLMDTLVIKNDMMISFSGFSLDCLFFSKHSFFEKSIILPSFFRKYFDKFDKFEKTLFLINCQLFYPLIQL